MSDVLSPVPVCLCRQSPWGTSGGRAAVPCPDDNSDMSPRTGSPRGGVTVKQWERKLFLTWHHTWTSQASRSHERRLLTFSTKSLVFSSSRSLMIWYGEYVAVVLVSCRCYLDDPKAEESCDKIAGPLDAVWSSVWLPLGRVLSSDIMLDSSLVSLIVKLF